MRPTLYFIVNQGAGTGRTARLWKKIKHMLEEQKIPYEAFFTEYEHHATVLARQLTAADDSALKEAVYLVVVGGDGTVNEVLNGIRDFDRVRLGVIPSGSGNDFARNLWIPKNPRKSLPMILECMDREIRDGIPAPAMDLGTVSWPGCEKPCIFCISAGVGLDAIVCKKALHSLIKKVLNALHLGKLTYLILTVASLFTMDTAEVTMTGDDHTDKSFHKMIFAAVMNLRTEGGGVPMAPAAVPTDGFLSVGSASGIPKWKTFFCLPFLVAAKQERIRGFEMTNAKNLVLESDKPMVLHADGEYCGDVRKAEFHCLKGRLRLLR